MDEADKARISNEAKVRTALEEPDFAQREFEKWRAQEEPRLKRETFVTAWAKVAWLAEGRMAAMGREMGKLQKRVGRQRKANRELLAKVRWLREENERLRYWAENMASLSFNVAQGLKDDASRAKQARYLEGIAREYWSEKG